MFGRIDTLWLMIHVGTLFTAGPADEMNMGRAGDVNASITHGHARADRPGRDGADHPIRGGSREHPGREHGPRTQPPIDTGIVESVGLPTPSAKLPVREITPVDDGSSRNARADNCRSDADFCVAIARDCASTLSVLPIGMLPVSVFPSVAVKVAVPVKVVVAPGGSDVTWSVGVLPPPLSM